MAGSSLPTVTVVIPCYNEHATLADCLDRLLEQRADLTQIILVDNNSTDDTAQIMQRYRKRYPQLVVQTFEKQLGVQHARNRGFDMATADIIARIDADAHVQPGFVRAIREGYGRHPEYMAASGLVDYYDLPFRWLTKAITWLFIYAANAVFTHSNTLYGTNMTIRRSTWRQVKSDVLLSDGIMEDTALSLALNRADAYIGHIRDAYVSASGRRLRSTPPSFWQYNSLWWRTYQKSGAPGKALGIRVIVWLCNAVQAVCWLGLLFHDPDTRTWGFRHLFHRSDHNRILP